MSADECRPVEVDGEIVSVRGSEPMDAEDRVMFGGVVRAAKARMAAERAAHDAEAWDEGVMAAFAGVIMRQNADDVKRTNPFRPDPGSPATSGGES